MFGVSTMARVAAMGASFADHMERIADLPTITVSVGSLQDLQNLDLRDLRPGSVIFCHEPITSFNPMPLAPEPSMVGCIAGWISDDDA